MPRKPKKDGDHYYDPFPQRLRNLMEKRGLKQEDLIPILNVKTRQSVTGYIDGSTSPTADKIISLALFFNVSSDYLLGLTGKKFVIKYDNSGELSMVGIVHGKHENVLFIEWIDYISMCQLSTFGRSPSMADEDILPDQYYEIEEQDLGDHRFFFSWNAVCDEFSRWNRERMKAK